MTKYIEVRKDDSEKIYYDSPDYPFCICRCLLSEYPGYSAPKHWHDDIECILVLSGEMNYNVNGKITKLKKEQGILVNARQIHFGYSDTSSECDFICILLHPIFLCNSAAYERDFLLPVLNNPAAPFISLHPEISWQKKILEQIYFMYDAVKRPKSLPLNIQSAFAAIWTLLYEHIPSTDTALGHQSSDLTILKNMVGYIQKNYAAKITLADIATAGSVGQSKCCKLFQKYLRQTPVLYLNQYRLDKSIGLLRQGEMSITEISLSVGFNSASYYAETFRKWTGKSPTEYTAGLNSNLRFP